MSNSPAKNNIMKKIRMALAHPTPLPFPKSENAESVFQPLQQDMVVEFAEQFTQLQGKFIFCVNEAEAQLQFNTLCKQNLWTKIYCREEPWKKLVASEIDHPEISDCDAAITSCEFLIARTGSIVLSSKTQGRIPSVYAPVHICMAKSSQLVYDIRDGLDALKEIY